MTTTTKIEPNESIQSPLADLPSTEKKQRDPRGRKPHTNVEAGVQQSLDATAPQAIAILRAHLDSKRGYRTLKPSIQRACEYVIDHAIGKARQKIEHSGGILTYGALAKEAEKIASKPRDVLADAEEIGGKRQRLADIQDPETARIRDGFEKMLAKVEALPEDKLEPLPDEPQSKTEGDSVKAVENLALAEELTPGTATDEP